MVFDDSARERFQFDRREFEPFVDEDNDDNDVHPADRLAELLEFLIGDEG